MPHAEFREWQEFYDIEPFGLAAQDAMQAHVARTIAEVNRVEKARPEPFDMRDFLIFREREVGKAAADQDEVPTVDGLTAEQWKIRLFFESLKRKREHLARTEQSDATTPPA